MVAVGFVGQRLDRSLGQFCGLFETLELLGLGVDQVGGVDAERLDRHRSAHRPQRAAGVERGIEIAAMERAPRILKRGRERGGVQLRSEEHTSALQTLMRNSYAVFCLKKKNNNKH